MDEQRLIDLEIKISHQEIAIEALQQSVYEQQKEIWRLQERLNRQFDRLEDLARLGTEMAPGNERPPHY